MDAVDAAGWTEVKTAPPSKAINAEGWEEVVPVSTDAVVVTPTANESYIPISQRASNVDDIMLESAAMAGKMAPKLLPAAGMIAGGMAAAPLTAGMSIPATMAIGGAMAGAGAGLGKGIEQKIEGQPLDMGSISKEAGKAAAWETGFRTIGITAPYVARYVAQSPRILNGIAKVLSAFTKGEYTSHNILEAMERAGVPAAMKAIESETEALKFAPRGTGKMSAENVTVATKKGGEKLAQVQKDLKEMRDTAGAEIGKADAELVTVANQKGVNSIPLKDIVNDLDAEILEIETNPILSQVVNVGPLKKMLAELTKKPNASMSIEDAIKTKRMISDLFGDFGNRGAMTVQESSLVQRSMMRTRTKLKELIQGKASDLGLTGFKDAYGKFGDFADDYDITLKPLFGSKEGGKFLEDRFIGLSNEIARRGNVLENVSNTSKLLYPTQKVGEVSKNINDLTDLMILRSIYQDIGHAPSSEITGMVRSLFVSPLAKKAIKMGNITEVAKPIVSTQSKVAPLIVGAQNTDPIIDKGIAIELKDHPWMTKEQAEMAVNDELKKDPKFYD